MCSSDVSSVRFSNDVSNYNNLSTNTNDLSDLRSNNEGNHSNFTDSNLTDTNAKTIISRKSKGLVFAHLNIRSVRNKMDDVKLIANNENVDVFTISGTWLSSDICDNEVSIPGYQLFRRDRTVNDPNNDHGGVACYVRDSLPVTHRTDLNVDGIEALWIEVKPKYAKPILVCTFYSQPSAYVEYFKRFDEKVQSINNDDVIILGDFNLDVLSDNTFKKVNDFCINNQFTQLIDEPTRVTESTSTLIDLICVCKPEEVTKSEVYTMV